MKFSKGLAGLVLAVFAGTISMGAFATPILEQDAFIKIERNPSPLGTSPIADPYGVGVYVPVTNSIAYGGGYINLSDADSNPQTYTMDPSWYTGPGIIYTTNSNTLNIVFDNLLVTAFTFRIGANTNASGWIKAYYSTDSGPEASLTTVPNFPISPSSSDYYGVYADNSGDSCTAITRITVEPPFTWGIGDFGITLGGGACTEVPEPESINLLGLGLLVMGLVAYGQRRRKLQLHQG